MGANYAQRGFKNLLENNKTTENTRKLKFSSKFWDSNGCRGPEWQIWVQEKNFNPIEEATRGSALSNNVALYYILFSHAFSLVCTSSDFCVKKKMYDFQKDEML